MARLLEGVSHFLALRWRQAYRPGVEDGIFAARKERWKAVRFLLTLRCSVRRDSFPPGWDAWLDASQG